MSPACPLVVLPHYSDPLLSALLKHLWQRLQPRVFLGMTLQAWLTCIWGVSPILLCRSSQVGLDGERRCAAIFRSLQRCLIGFKSGLWLGRSRTFRDFSQSHCCVVFGCVRRVAVLLEGEPLSQSEDLSTLEQIFIKDLSVLAPFIFPSILTLNYSFS